MSGLIECTRCGNKMHPAEFTPDRRGIPACKVCSEHAINSATTIKEFRPDGVSEYIWTDMFGFQDKHSHKRLFKIPAIDWYESISSNWVVHPHGDHVAVMRGAKVAFNDPQAVKLVTFMRNLTNQSLIPPFPIYLNMTQIGGLQMSIDLIVHRGDVDRFKIWTQSRLH